MTKRTTIKDLAKLAGVNVSTVSRALKDHPDIGVTLREKIKKLAIEHNYHPNMLAVGLRKQKSHIIGLIIPEAIMFFIPSVIKGISDVVHKLGYRLMILQSGESLEQEIENVRTCLDNNIDGLLITLTNQTKQLDHLKELKEAGIPVVLFDKVLEETYFDEILIDDFEATRTCVQHLIDSGCKRILGMFGNINLSITTRRLEGFNKTINSAKHLGVSAECHFAAETMQAWQIVENTFNDFKPDGIFAMSDELIAGVVPALHKLHVKIPEQCEVIGFSDGFLPNILDPGVAYMHHDGYMTGQMAGEHLIKKINHPSSEDFRETIILPTVLVTHLAEVRSVPRMPND